MEELANVAPPQNLRTPVQKAQNKVNALKAQLNGLNKGTNRVTSMKRHGLQRSLQNARRELEIAKKNKTRKNLHNSGVSDYIVIEGNDSETFKTDIMKKMSEGYVLQGGVSYVPKPGKINYIQAMVKQKEPLRNLLANNTNLLNF